jgi:tetratricopeptide (TPR) repeat protein
MTGEIQQEECDFFFRYQLEEVRCVKRSAVEARRVIELIRKAIIKGYDTSGIFRDHNDFFEKYGANLEEELGDYDRLISAYKRIIETDPHNSEAHCNLGIIYEKRGMIDSAISEYRISLYIDPDNARARRAVERLRDIRRGAN